MLAALIVVAAVILLLTLVINGPNRMLTSEELALEQTRIAQEIVLKQTEIAKTSAAGLYLTLGVPIPTETPFVIPTGGALGQPTRTSTSSFSSEANDAMTQSVIRTAVSQPGTATLISQFQTSTALSVPGKLTATPTITASPNPGLSGWDGEWTAYFDDQGAITKGYLDITVSDDEIEATASFDGGLILFSGTIDSGGTHVDGTYTSEDGSGDFYWRLLNENELGGNLNLRFGICANKKNNPVSNPCFVVDNR